MAAAVSGGGHPPHGRYYAELVPTSPETVLRQRFRNCSTRVKGRNGTWSGLRAACRRGRAPFWDTAHPGYGRSQFR